MLLFVMQAEFDQNNVVVISGTLKKVNWVNPHVNFLIDVPNPDGTSTTWTLVHAGPNQMRAAGLSDRDFFKVGEKYTASLALARNGTADQARDAAKAAAPYIHAKPQASVKIESIEPIEEKPVNVLELAKQVAFLFTLAQVRPEVDVTPVKLN